MPLPDEEALQESPLLSYIEHNPSGKSTILLIHGACTTSQNWNLVAPHLADKYHLLIPDLPGHGSSAKTAPTFSLDSSVNHLARLIRAKAHEARAHVIGHSLGANITISLISAHPGLINAVFISGYAKFPQTKFTGLFAYGFWAENRLERLIPRGLVQWLMDGTDLGDSGPSSLKLCRQIAVPLMDPEWPSSWSARTLIVVAGKSGILPTSDRVQDAERLRDIGREGNREMAAFVHADMRHPWNRQAPELFAQTARAWFEDKEIPSGFEVL